MLPQPVTFVCRIPTGLSGLYESSRLDEHDVDLLQHYVSMRNSWEINWILRTYIILKRMNLNVSLSPKLVPGTICVIMPASFGIRDYRLDCFIVGCRADDAKPCMCDLSIVQNKANVESEREIYIPHWPHPGLIPRLPERGPLIENMVYKGRSFNLYHKFRSEQFVAELANLGVRFESHDEHADPVRNWRSYQTSDLILAVRDLTERDALVKPASKLVNAWMAGAPALLGPEPAFRDIRQSSLDYVEVRSTQDVLDVIRRFKAQPTLYEEMVANGETRWEYSEKRTAQRWVDAFCGPVAEAYARWLRSAWLARVAAFPVRAIRRKLARRAASRNARHGFRIVSQTYT